MSNKKKSSKPKKMNQNNSIKSYGKSSSVVGNIYTYKKHRKPKIIGKTCIYFDKEKLACKISHQLCKNADNCKNYAEISKDPLVNQPIKKTKKVNNIPVKKNKRNINEVGITAIVLNDNRKCTNNNHKIIDINATLRIAKSDGTVMNYTVPAAYCEICDTYFVLKKDYKTAKAQGVILCPIIDMTKKVNLRTQKFLSTSESRIHQLGYNVRQGNGYTKEQRQLILANILENTNISRHEVESCILRPMKQHRNQNNYADAVKAWEQDLEFVRSYQIGDIPEVLVNKLIIGKRM